MSVSEPVALRAVGLCRNFSSKAGERKALDALDLELRQGEVFGLLGPNGGGKSTLFRIAATLLPPSAGELSIFGHDVVREPEAVRRRLGVVFQMPSLDAKLTVRENLRLHGQLFGITGKALRLRCDELLERFTILDRAKDLVASLSGGLARRVEIAKGMMPRPDLLLLDEPSTGLDPGARRELQDLLFAIRKEDGTTILWTTHFLDEADACDRIAILHQGKRIALGSPSELKSEIPGAIVMADVRNARDLAARCGEQLGVSATLVGGALRFELVDGDGYGFAERLAKQLGDDLLSVTIGRASLEDVFLARTGHAFDKELLHG